MNLLFAQPSAEMKARGRVMPAPCALASLRELQPRSPSGPRRMFLPSIFGGLLYRDRAASASSLRIGCFAKISIDGIFLLQSEQPQAAARPTAATIHLHKILANRERNRSSCRRDDEKGEATICHGFGKRYAIPSLQFLTFAGVVTFLSVFSAREPSSEGAVAIFILLLLPVAAAMLWSRRTFSIGIAVATILLLLDAADNVKYDLVVEHLHAIDFATLWGYVKNGDLILLELYAPTVAKATGALVAGLALLSTAAWTEGLVFRHFAHWEGSAKLGTITLIAACVNASIFLTGNYFWATSNQFIFSRLKRGGPFVISQFLSSITDYMEVRRELTSTQRRTDIEEVGSACSQCPDIITIHVESVFDPKMLASYSGSVSLTDLLSPRLVSLNGPLKTYVIGGYSIISEFSFNCGLDHRVFGTSGLYPNLFIPDAIRRCIPGFLRDVGYQTEIVSSAPPNVLRYGDVYKAYGINQMYGPGSFGIPTNWVKMRDGFFVDAAIKLLEQPRNTPRLVMLLTVFNHGPHGTQVGIDRSEVYEGPYKLRLAESDEVRDYMNRLNDSIVAFGRLEEWVANRTVPTVLIYYGDHHPNFRRVFSREAISRWGSDVDTITFYRIARNFAGANQISRGPYLGIDQLFGTGLAFGGVRPPSELISRDRILQRCGGKAMLCSSGQLDELRAIFLK